MASKHMATAASAAACGFPRPWGALGEALVIYFPCPAILPAGTYVGVCLWPGAHTGRCRVPGARSRRHHRGAASADPFLAPGKPRAPRERCWALWGPCPAGTFQAPMASSPTALISGAPRNSDTPTKRPLVSSVGRDGWLYVQGEGGPSQARSCRTTSTAQPWALAFLETLLSSRDGEWWNVVSLVTGKECSVPSSHVAKVWHRWLYEGVSREKAEELLLLPCNHSGSFLIRESQTRQGCYSLSVRRTNHSSWDSVKHYRINRLENGWLYIAPRLTFPSLQELVDYYSEIGDGLCCLLKEPCFIQGAVRVPAQNLAPPVVVKKSSLNWQELDSSALFSEAPAPEGESPVSLGLREAISSYLFLTEELPPEKGEKGSLWKSA
ncbi:src-like-adapter 2 isoform X1 [Mauremys reevesii]|uniref:src-like-adapter 2 isoform X1 n=1 Tax=Mauremys reevesii TaxID=260615 RepID=UPI00193EDE5E|nr:src-like-adapter 2 isoform X1 [Mauremys reevesii]